jgi:prepilin-type N-terminal cleavage/methylation domain-containing protein
MIRQGALEDERGFTLAEVMVVIVMMSIVAAMAIYTWFGAVESRRVDSATNQVAADLRLANTQATNRLADSDFTTPDPTPPGGVVPLSTYEIGAAGAVASDRLPEGTQIAAATNIKFMANGSAQVISGPAPVNGTITITVRSSNNAENNHTIQINTTTSRIKVVP